MTAVSLDLSLLKLERPPCSGLIFRYTESTWIDSSGSLNTRARYSLLKRASCTCCRHLIDDLREMIHPRSSSIIYPERPEVNGLYRLRVVNESTDWESGIVDDWDLEFSRISP